MSGLTDRQINAVLDELDAGWFHLSEDEVRALLPVLNRTLDAGQPTYVSPFSQDVAAKTAERMSKWLEP